jgi:hypothetical protein
MTPTALRVPTRTPTPTPVWVAIDLPSNETPLLEILAQRFVQRLPYIGLILMLGLLGCGWIYWATRRPY